MSGLFVVGVLLTWLMLVIRGQAGVIVQGFPEANAKNGTQWEVQRRLEGMALNQEATSIIRTGNLPVDLKERLFAYTGLGIEANIYMNPVYTGGTTVGNEIYNMNTIPGVPATLQTQVLTGFTLTSPGQRVGTPLTLIGPAQVQGKGSLLSAYGRNRILAPNTSYLLVFKSLDADQTVTARLEFYEGELDLPYRLRQLQ